MESATDTWLTEPPLPLLRPPQRPQSEIGEGCCPWRFAENGSYYLCRENGKGVMVLCSSFVLIYTVPFFFSKKQLLFSIFKKWTYNI